MRIAISALAATLALITACTSSGADEDAIQDALDAQEFETARAALGQVLFFDTNLSRNRTQACATCHAPQHAFTDTRVTAASGDVSLGDDGTSFGDRHTPALGYVALTPDFHIDSDGDYRGGLFYDGRAANLVEQAKAPIINPIEMALTDAAMVAQRIAENPTYVTQISTLYGRQIFDDPEQLHAAVADALSAFERTSLFQPFDSRYDRHLRGEYELSAAEETGRILFFSDLISCNGCHHLDDQPDRETFTDYTYHNIGVPVNTIARTLNGSALDFIDGGLAENVKVAQANQRGKFKVPSLRNISVTAPYMHNGVFNDLETVLRFYNTYIITDTLNPETGEAWRVAEVDENISLDLLKQGQPLSEMHIQAVLAFLHTLTDARFEHLLADQNRKVEQQTKGQ